MAQYDGMIEAALRARIGELENEIARLRAENFELSKIRDDLVRWAEQAEELVRQDELEAARAAGEDAK